MGDTMLVVERVTVRFGERAVLDGVSLDVGAGEIVGILGPSGSGKSTLLRVIAGIVRPDTGRVFVGGVDVTSVPTHRRGVGMVFQGDELFPHLDVAGNIAFGLRMRGTRRRETTARVAEMLELVGLSGFERRTVGSLSGGEAKRVALARSLAPRPSLLLLDEPLSGLDAELHDRLVGDVRDVLRSGGPVTALHVTHDVEEARRLTDRIVRLRDLQEASGPR
jgi:thiamine transport system ATP-binding protein